MTGKNPNSRKTPPEPFWEDCPTCTGTGKVKGIPPGAIVIRTRCKPRAGAPQWSDSPKEIAYYLGILEVFVRIEIRKGYIRPKLIKGKKYYRLSDVKERYEICDLVPGAGWFFFEDMLEEAFPGVPFVWDSDLDGYTVEEDFLRRARRAL